MPGTMISPRPSILNSGTPSSHNLGRSSLISAPGLITRSRNSMEYGEIHYMNTVRDFWY